MRAIKEFAKLTIEILLTGIVIITVIGALAFLIPVIFGGYP